MKFSQLLQQRDMLLRQARLANVAFAYAWLKAFVARADRAGLRGVFNLRDGDPANGHPWPTLTAEAASPAVVAEHFLEEDVVELADILAYVYNDGRPLDRSFRWKDLAQTLLPALRRELEEAGIPPQEPVAPGSDSLG